MVKNYQLAAALGADLADTVDTVQQKKSPQQEFLVSVSSDEQNYKEAWQGYKS
jgi:hypothetical protein